MDDLKYLAGFLVPINGKIPNINDLVKETPTMPEPKPFTKSDLKDGMRVELDTTDLVFYVCGNKLAVPFPLGNHWGEIDTLDGNLQSVSTGAKVMKVTDRDGTVLFERKPEKRKVTLELTE